jgi:hypothetical protein
MPHRFVWKRLKRLLVHHVLHVDDTPHRIALAVAIGLFVAWTPTIGFQMGLTVVLAWLLGANKVVGVPLVWISNPLTLAPIYLPNYYLGRWILGGEVRPPDFSRVVNATGGWLETVSTWWSVTWHVLLPLWVGSLLVGLALAVPAYLATYHGVVIYRRKLYNFHVNRLERKHRRRDAQASKAAKTRFESDPPGGRND